MKCIANKQFFKSYIFTYLLLCVLLCSIYTIIVATISTLMEQKFESIYFRPELLLSLYFLLPFSLGILLELRQHKFDKGTTTVFGYIVGLIIGLSLAASIRYGFIIGTAILLLFFIGFFGGQRFQRHIVRSILKILQPIISAMILNVKLIGGYILLCIFISFIFAIGYAQLQIHSGSGCDFRGIDGLSKHIVNSFSLMITLGTIGTKAQCDLVEKLYVVQYFIFSILTLIFGALLIKTKKTYHNIQK